MKTTSAVKEPGQEDICIARWERLGEFGNGELRGKLVELFRRHTPSRILAAADAVRNGHLRTLAEVTHSLKSSAGNLGLVGIQTLSGTIEEDALSGRTERLAELVGGLRAGFDRVRAWLDAVTNGGDS